MHALNLLNFQPPNSFLDCLHPSVFLQSVITPGSPGAQLDLLDAITHQGRRGTSVSSSPQAYLPSRSPLHSTHTKDREIVLNNNNKKRFHKEFVTILKLKA